MKAEEIAKIIEEKALAEKLNACKTAEDALTVLKEAGADVTLEELQAFCKALSGEQPTGELSDDDLEEVAGGAMGTKRLSVDYRLYRDLINSGKKKR